MWARLLSSTNQPSFLSAKDIVEDKKDEESVSQTLLDTDVCLDNNLSTEKSVSST